MLRSGERLHMRSESQTRWEKGVAPELAEPAANYATELLVELAGARWTGHADVKADFPERPRSGFARRAPRRSSASRSPRTSSARG